MSRADNICEKIQSKYDCLCCIDYAHTGPAGIRVFLYFLGKTPAVREELCNKLKSNGAIIAIQDNGDIMIHDFDSLEKAVEAL